MVNVVLLCITMSNKPSFILNHSSVFFVLDSKYPLASYCFAPSKKINKLLSIICKVSSSIQIAFFQYAKLIRSPIAFLYICGSTILLLTLVTFIATSSVFGSDLRDFKNKKVFLESSIIFSMSESNIAIAGAFSFCSLPYFLDT